MVLMWERPRFDLTSKATGGEESTAGDVVDATLESMRLGENANSRLVAVERAYDKRIDDIKGVAGVELTNPVTNAAGPSTMAGFGIQEETDPHADFQKRLEELAEQHPDQREIIAPDRSVMDDAKVLAQTAEKRSEDVWARSSGGLAAWSARLGGGFYGAMHDPVNVFTMGVGPAGQAAKGAKGLLWMGLMQGAANAGTEAAIQPFVQSWRKEAGLEHGLGQAALNVGAAGAFGFGLDAGVRAGIRGVRRAAGRPYLGPDAPAPGGTEPTGARLPGLPEGRAAEAAPVAPRPYRGADPIPPMEALERAAKNAPEGSILRRAADGDEAALRELAKELGPDADPAIRRALDEIEIEKLFPTPLNVDDGAHLESLARAIRHESGAADLPAGDAISAPIRREIANLADEAVGRALEVEGRPVGFRPIDPRQVTTDASTFQFKSGGDAAGVTDRLRGVTRFDPVSAGKTIVFERADGQMVIADGHQRLGLAKRVAAQGQDAKLDAYVFREADGWTPEDVRAYAALKNMRESSGTSVDMAQVMRDRPDLIDGSLPLTDAKLRDAAMLARLSPEAFDAVVAGRLPPPFAALIGESVADAARHRGLLDEMAAADLANTQQARLYLKQLMELPTTTETQMTLFGEESFTRTVLVERAQVLDSALRTLKADKRIFGLLRDQARAIEGAGNVLARDANQAKAESAAQLAELIEKLATSRGTVATILNDAAASVARGLDPKLASRAFVDRIADTLEKEGLPGLVKVDEAPEPELAPVRMDDPLGPEAKAQADDVNWALELDDEIMFAIRAFHGTPYDFDRFDLSKIGTGEGAQVFGHGLYFAENKTVADQYRDALSMGQVRIDGQPETDLEIASLAEAKLKGLLGEREIRAREWVEEARAALNAPPAKVDKDSPLAAIMEHLPEDRQRDLVNAEEYLAKIEKVKAADVTSGGSVYEVDIDVEPRQLLDHDAKLADQPEMLAKITPLLKQVGSDVTPESLRTQPGSWVYSELQVYLGSADAASKALREAGIPGIRYLDQGSRSTSGGELLEIGKDQKGFRAKIRVTGRGGTGFTTPTDSITTSMPFPTEAAARAWADEQINSGTRNIVIFDDSLIKITKKNGEPVTAKERQDAVDAMFALRDGKADQTQTPEFKRWFGESKVVDAEGKPLVVYHQTAAENVAGIEERGFDLSRVGARGSDDLLPDGVFLKPTAADIGVGATDNSAQMPLYAAIRNPLVVRDRKALADILMKDAEYKRLKTASDELDQSLAAEYDTLYERIQNASDEQIDALFERGNAQIREASSASRARATALIREAGHDGLIIENDVGSFGRSTKTFVAFEPAQVKSTGNRGTFDPNDPRIAFAAPPRNATLHNTTLSTRAADEMASIRAEIDNAVAKSLPAGWRAEVRQSLVFGDLSERIQKRNPGVPPSLAIEGTFDPYERIIYVSMAALDPVERAFEEAGHAIKAMRLIPQSDYGILQAKALEIGAREKFKIDERYGDVYGARWKDDPARLEEALEEEAIMQMVAARARGDDFGKQSNVILDKLIKFLRAIRDMLGLKGFRSFEDVFEDMTEGGFARAMDAQRGGAGAGRPIGGEVMAGGPGKTAGPVPGKSSSMEDDAAFEDWFRDSKVTDPEGRPLTVYHATKSDVQRFDLGRAGASDPGLVGKAFYFTPSARQASDIAESPLYGKGGTPNIMPVNIALKNPLEIVDGALPDGRRLSTDIHPQGLTPKSAAAFQKEIKRAGYDGVVFRLDGEISQVVAFKPDQIRSIFQAKRSPGTPSEGSLSLSPTDAAAGASITQTPAFRKWFGGSKVVDAEGKPLTLYHGTGADIDRFNGMAWGSQSAELANDYAAMRDMTGGQGNVMPVYLRIETPFNADALPKVVRIGEFFDEVLAQANAGGRQLDPELSTLIDTVHAGARREESGPRYDRHEFWNDAASLFGADGAQAIREIFRKSGFDGVKMTEGGALTFGAFDPTQIKSAIGNRGTFDPTDPRISFSIREPESPTATDASFIARAEAANEIMFALGDEGKGKTPEGKSSETKSPETGGEAKPAPERAAAAPSPSAPAKTSTILPGGRESKRIRNLINQAAAEGKLPREDADALIQRYDALEQFHKDGGKAKQQIAKELDADAAKRKANKELAELKRRIIVGFLVGVRDARGQADPAKAYQALIENLGQLELPQGFVDVAGHQRAIYGMALAELDAMLHEFKGVDLSPSGVKVALTGATRNKARLANVVRELHGEATGDELAAGFAQAAAKVMEDLRFRFNAAGGSIAKRKDWAMPQSHDKVALLKAKKEAWVDFITPLLDQKWMKHPLTGDDMPPADVRKTLGDVYDNLVADGWHEREAEMVKRGLSAISNTRADPRSLIFKDADAWMKYSARFGSGDDALAIIISHIRGMTKDIAAMEVLGPNPTAMLEYIRQFVVQQASLRRAGMPAHFPTHREITGIEFKPGSKFLDPVGYANAMTKRAENMWRIYTGAASAPESPGWAEVSTTVKNINVATKLGGAFVSGLGDPFWQIAARKFAGLPAVKMFPEILNQIKAGGEREARRSGVIAETFLHMHNEGAREGAAWSASKVSGYLADRVLTLSMLSSLTRAGNHAMSMGIQSHLADMAGKAFGDLDPRLQRMFRRWGLEATDWDAIRLDAAGRARDVDFLSPADIRRQLVDNGGDPAIAERYLAMTLGEAQYATLTGTITAQARVYGNMQAGTAQREMWSMFMQFKSFAVNLAILQISRMAREAVSQGLSRGAQYAFLAVSMATLGGALVEQLQQLRNGKDPRAMTTVEFWGSALYRSGGLSIWGDLLYASENRFGGGVASTFAGPTAGTLNDLLNLTYGSAKKSLLFTDDQQKTNFGRQLSSAISRYTPGSSIWYARVAWERALMDNLQRMLDPEAEASFRRKIQNAKRDYKQDFWWKPGGGFVPQRGPRLGAAFPGR